MRNCFYLRRRSLLKYLNLIILMALMVFAGCNNPSGGSSIATNHTPLLQPPGAFSFNQIRSQNGDVTLRWSKSSRASTYAFFMGTASNDISTPVPSCSNTTTSCSLTGLNPTTVYYFSVTASNAAGSLIVSSPGVALSVGTFDITSSSVGDSLINLSWTAATNATAYDVIYGTSPGSYPSIATNVTSPYTLTGLSNGVRYYVRVVARNTQNGYGLSDSEINEQPFGPPGAPQGVGITPAPGQTTLTWTDTPGATSYKVYRGTVSGTYSEIANGITTPTYIDTTVANGTTYFYAVRGFNGFDSAYSTEVSARTIANFSVTSVVTGPGPSQITATWPAVAGAAAFDIQYGTNPASLDLSATNVTSPHVLSGLTGNVTYYVRVVARNSVGPGASVTSLNQLSAIPVLALAAPAGVTATATPGQVLINWNSVAGASSYEVLRGTVSGTYASVSSGIVGTSYTDTAVSNGTAYYYVVRAFNGLNSPNSSEVAAKPIANITLSSVTPASATGLTVTWSAGAGADAYDVMYGTASGTYTTTVSNVTSPYSLTGLVANTTYYLVVRGRNAVGAGTFVLTGQGSATTKTTPPASLVATTTSGNVLLDWATTAGATSYNVYRGTVSGTHSLLAGGITATDYTDATAVNGTAYYYVVTADNGSESANSSEVAGKPIANFTLTSTSAPSPTSLIVTWPAVTGADSYDVQYGTATGSYTSTLTNRTSPFTITGLVGGTTYYVRVQAKNAVGTGSNSNSNELSQTTPVGPPVGVLATVTTGQIQISWTAMTGASSYKVYRGTTSGTYSLLQSGIAGTNYTDASTVDGTQYYYVVKSFNGADSADSAEVTGKNIAPFTLTSVTAPSSTSLVVTFPGTAGGDVYDVRYGTATGSYTTTVSGVTSPYTITGLTANTNYFVVARARNVIGTGAAETTNEISIRTPVAVPSGLAAASTPAQVVLTWGAVSGATNYNVYRGTSAGTTTLLASAVATATYTDTSVSNGTTYYYAVTSFNGSESAKSSEVATQPIASHSITSLSSPSSTSITVTWGAVTGASAFDVLWGTTSGSYTGSSLNQSSPFTITGLTANTLYYVVVRAKNSVGAGTNRNSTEASQRTLTTTPVGLVATASSGQVGLNWTATAGASSYNVYRGTVSGSLSLLASSVATTAYLDTTVANGTTYFYTISANNGAESAQSSEVSVRPIASFSISSLTAVSASSLSVSWGAAAGAATYDVRYGTSPGVYLTTVTGVTSPYTLTGLTGNTQYYVVIRANNAVGAGTSIQTSEMNVTTSTAAPTALAATATTSQIDLSWVAASGATNYRVYRGTTSGSYSQIASGVSGTTYSDTTVANGTQYYYSVRSFNGTESVDSNEATGKSIATFSVGGTTSPSSTSIQVTWTAPAGGDLSDVRYGTTSGSYTTVSGVTSPYTITGLTANTTYYIVVRARNTVGLGSSVQTAEVTQRTATVAPSGLVASATPGSVALTWAATTGATSYNVYRGTTSGSYSSLATGVGTTSYTDATAANGTTYFYVVTSVNGSESAYSNEVTIRPVASFAITSATTVSTTQVDVVWPAVAGAAAYDVKYGTTTGSYTTTLSNQTSPVSLTGLAPGSTYYIVVVARNAVGPGTSFQSGEVSAQTAFGAPGGVAVSATPGQAIVTWSTVSGAASYAVYRTTTSGSYGAALASGLTAATYTDTTVSNGTTYYYIVRAVTGGGVESPNSLEVAVRPISTFSLSSATPTSSSNINLVWTAATGAATYDVRYGTSTGSYTTTLSNQTSPLSVTGLSANTTYYFQIQAKNAVGTGTTVNSTEVSAKTATAGPSGLVATATTGQISLTWANTSGATNYNIYRSTTSGSYGAALATAVAGLTYTDTTVANGTTYYYVVRANNGIESANSNEHSALPIAAFALTSVTAPTTTTAVVTWPATAGASTYDVRYGTSTGSYTTTLTNRTSPFTITGLTAGTTYYVVVRANNAVGSGSSAQTAELSVVTPLAAPSGLTATSTPGSVALAWSAVGGASSYKVYRSTTSGSYGAALATGVGTNSYTDSTATNGTTYFYVVKAFNGSDSADSNEATTRPIANFSISSLTAPSSTSIQVTWTGPAGGATYDVRYGTATGSYSTTLSNQTSPVTISGLTANQNYYVIVVAKNAVGTGTSLNSSESTVKTPTGAPTGLVASATPGSVGLNWTAVSGASSYKVYRGTVSGSLSLIGSPGSNAYLDTTVTNGTTYFYAVVSNNGSDSAQSAEVSVRPIASFSLTAATAASATSINLTWGSAAGAATYEVRYGTSTGVYLTSVTGVTSPYTLTGLTANTTYYISIRATNAVGAGTNFDSNELNAKTAVGAPTGLAVIGTPGNAALSWPTVSGATNYNVYRGTASGGPYSQIASAVAGLSYNDTTVANGTVYYYVIRAFNGIESANSNEVAVKTIANFTLAAATVNSSTQITLSWGAAAGADFYDVQYGTATGTYTTTLPGVTSAYAVTGLSVSTLYYFSIRGRNTTGAGTTNNSNEVTGRTATAAPTTLAATAGTGVVNLTWVAASGATNYNIYRGTSTGVYSLLASAVSVTNYADNTVVNGTTYYYAVRSFNGTESANSNEATATPIGAFSISATTATTTTIQVTWGAASGATAYDVKIGTVSGTYGTTFSNVTSPYTITGRTTNTNYFIIVTARNTSGGSVNTPEVSQITALAAPVGLAATGGSGSVSLSWTAVSGATSYKVHRGTTSGSLSLLASGIGTTTYADNTPSNGTTYYYAVIAFNGADSALSTEVFKQPIALPVISSVVGNTTTSIQLTWAAATGASTYDVQWGTVSGTYGTTITGVTSPYTITGLTSGVTYYVRVRANNAIGGGTSVFSLESSGSPNSPPVLSTIANQTTEVGFALPVPFTLSDSNHVLTCAGSMSGSSSNTTVLPNSGIVFSGSLPNCTVTLTPAAAQVGTSTVTITADDGVTTTSRTFTLTTQPCTVASIAWETQPTGMAAGNLFGTAPRVSLRKADNSLCTTNPDPVVIDIVDDNSVFQDAEITAGESVVPSGGYALFNAARMERAGSNFTINATHGSIQSAESSAFNVTALAASKLVWQQQPLSSLRSATIIPNPVVRTADVYGNYVANGSSITVTVSLQNNEEAATLGGTLSRSSSSTYTFSNLTVSKVGQYVLRATTTAFGGFTLDSDLFDVLIITNQDTVAAFDLIQAPIIHSPTANVNTYYRRAATYFGTSYFDGTLSYELQVVATNTSSVTGTVRFTSSTTTVASVTIPIGTTTPTLFTSTTFTSVPSATSNIRLYALGQAITIHSARIVVKQTNATKTQIQIPLTNLPSTVTSIQTAFASSSAGATQPNVNYFPPFYFDKSKIGRIDTAFLFMTYKSVTSTSTCASLWNKDTGTIIGAEVCGTSTSETAAAYQFSSPSVLPNTANIEVRVRNNVSAKVTDVYKVFLVFRLVNITDVMNTMILNPSQISLAASNDYTGGRIKNVAGSYGIVPSVSTYVTCRAKANTSGAGAFVLKTHGTTNSGTAGATNVTASTINFTSQSSLTTLEAGPLAVTDANRLYINYTHTSGNFDSAGCIYRDEATY